MRSLALKRMAPVILLALGQTLVWAGLFYVFPAMLIAWHRDLPWTKPVIFGAITTALICSAVASPLFGRLIDRGWGAPGLALSAIAGGLALACLSWMHAIWQFYSIWAFIGVMMAGCLYEPCFAILTRARGADAKSSIITITLIAGFASTISYPSAHFLIDAYGWRHAVLVIALVVILIAAPMLWFGASLLEHRNPQKSAPTKPVLAKDRSFLSSPGFWSLALAFSILAFVHGATLQHLLPMLMDRGFSNLEAVMIASFVGPMQVAGRIVMLLTGRFTSHHTTAILAFLAMATSMAILLFSNVSWILIAFFVLLFGGSWGTVSILRPVIARDLLGEADFGAKSGYLAIPFLAGAAMAPYAGSLAWLWGGYPLMISALLIATCLGLALYVAATQKAPAA